MFGVIGLVLCGMAFILNIVGLAIPYWFYYSKTLSGASTNIYYGLWRICVEFQDQIKCNSYDNTLFGDLRKFFNVNNNYFANHI